MRGRPARVALLFFAGSLLIQAAWIISLPPFRGSDEFDHAYRAAAVAEGQWKPKYEVAEDGRGWYLTVPRSLVEAASPVCESYEYTGPENCNPVRNVNTNHVTVASAAAKYSPVYYWLVGTPSLIFEDGAAKVLAMRVTGSILCSLMIAIAGGMLATWSRTRWTPVALAVTLTPVAIYSTSLGAPNGLEMLSGLVVWCALLGISRVNDLGTQTRLVYAAIPAAVALVGMRAIGPLWLILISLSVVLTLGRQRVTTLLLNLRWHLLIAAVSIVLATSAAAWWILATGMSTEPEGPGGNGYGTVVEHLRFVPLWVLQSIAAFPVRDEPAPPVVYACVLVVIVSLLAVALKTAERRVRLSVLACSFAGLAFSSIFNLATYDAWGPIWQGRYALPYLIGVPILAGYAMDRLPKPPQIGPGAIWIGATLLAVAHTVSVTNVLVMEKRFSPLAGTPAWHIPPQWLVAILIFGGILCWAKGCRVQDPCSGEPTSESTQIRATREKRSA